MPISDLISTSFLFSIAIIIILIGGIFAYVSYRMSEQDHKLTSMLGLVSTLAEEMHSLKNRQNNDSIVLNTKGDNKDEDEEDDDEEETSSRKEIHIFDQNMLSGGTDINLISVSDNESDSTDSESSDSDSDCESSDSESSSGSDDDEPANNVKILNISAVNEFKEDFVNDFTEDFVNDFKGEVLVEDFTEEVLVSELEELAELLEDLEDLEDLDTKSIHLAEPIDLIVSDSMLDISELKSIMISDKPDYKKMGLNKLREVVVERNIISGLEAGKLKKHDLLKLLGDKE